MGARADLNLRQILPRRGREDGDGMTSFLQGIKEPKEVFFKTASTMEGGF
jgi:hypothetical protein